MPEIKNIRFTNQSQRDISIRDDTDKRRWRSGDRSTPLSIRRWRTAMSTRSPELSATRSGFVAVLRAASFGLVEKIYALVVAWVNRRAAGQYLLSMDERMLADIGLTRGDLRSAWSEPVWCDPTTRLQRIAAERRAARLAQRAVIRHPQPRPPVSAINLRRESQSEAQPAKRTASPRLECGEAA
jgi:uncharacterized protein YjiS (DUF1127 family)